MLWNRFFCKKKYDHHIHAGTWMTSRKSEVPLEISNTHMYVDKKLRYADAFVHYYDVGHGYRHQRWTDWWSAWDHPVLLDLLVLVRIRGYLYTGYPHVDLPTSWSIFFKPGRNELEHARSSRNSGNLIHPEGNRVELVTGIWTDLGVTSLGYLKLESRQPRSTYWLRILITVDGRQRVHHSLITRDRV